MPVASVACPLAARSPEPKALAKQLVRRGWLTLDQANHLLRRRAAVLLLGLYGLLDRLGAGQVFKARQYRPDYSLLTVGYFFLCPPS
jgi:hypothetical protein